MPQLDLLASTSTMDRAAVAARQESLFSTLVTLLDRLADDTARAADVIAWGCPVPAFGDPTTSRVATLGLNPSNREFVDDDGVELAGDARRFHTLASLGLPSWDDAEAEHLDRILASCRDYFAHNPYDRWFRRLDSVVSATGTSFYDPASPACHLDLIPYATARKWTELTTQQRSGLLRLAGDTLGLLLRRSAVRVLILNGQAVVSHFQEATGIALARAEMPGWALPRQSGENVPGYAYRGRVDGVSGYQLPHALLVLGFNHNLQSSFGVTSRVIGAIRAWVGHATNGALRQCATTLS
jgi:hypothetical protein